MSYYTSTQAVFRLSTPNSAFLSQMLAATTGRDATSTIALAMVVAAQAPLPGGTVDSPEAYFMDNAGTSAAEALGVINNLVPVDCKGALDLAVKLYLMRYEMANRPFTAFGYDRREGINSIFGMTAHLSKDTLAVMQNNAQAITDKYARFTEIVNELKKD